MTADLITNGLAIAFATVIFARAICVLYTTSPKKHSHPAHFIGFGYSYVTLGAGAAFAAVALCFDHPEIHDLALWLLLLGSCGLIIFDRRAAACWASESCPMDDKK